MQMISAQAVILCSLKIIKKKIRQRKSLVGLDTQSHPWKSKQLLGYKEEVEMQNINFNLNIILGKPYSNHVHVTSTNTDII